MKKSLLSKECSEHLISRVQKISADSPALWGSMNATEMLLHCNVVNEQLLKSAPSQKSTGIKHYISRLLFLYLLPNYPRNAKTPKRNITKGQIDASFFVQQQQKFIDIIHRFPLHQKPIELPHPYFGNLNTGQWGLAGYKHVDHHLRQFGA